MRFISKKISRRFFAALMLVAIVPILILGYGAYKIAQDVVIRHAFMHIQTIAQDHVHHLDIWFQERLGDIQMISQLPFVQALCHAYCMLETQSASSLEEAESLNSILALTRGKSPSYRNVYIFNPLGVLLASASSHSEEVADQERKALFEAVERSGEPVLGPVHEHGDRKWTMHLAAPIRNQDGRIVALTVAVLDVSATLDPIFTDRSGLGKTGETYLVNREGQIITESRHLTRSETLDRSFHTVGILAVLDGKEGTTIYDNYMDHEVVGSYAWLPRYGWGLLAEMETDEILAPVSHIRTAVIFTTLIVGLLCVLLALLASRRVSRPIISVAEAAREIAQGRLDRRIAFDTPDEVGVLSESFNSMAEELSHLITALRQKEISLQQAYEELLETQENLVRSGKMAAVGELVTSVVHEMRNPLSSVKLNLQIIGRTMEKGSLLSEHYGIALDQVMQLDRMFTDLLNYSKPLTLDPTQVNIETLVDESLQQLDPLLKEKEVTVARRLDTGLLRVMADPDKLRQVLVNIVKNAVEATARDGHIEMESSFIDTNGNAGIVLTISDHGTGISAQDLERIFQPFFTTKKKGTGLGLCIVKKILDAHGSSIQVSSEEGQGTVVQLHLQGVRDEKNPNH